MEYANQPPDHQILPLRDSLEVDPTPRQQDVVPV